MIKKNFTLFISLLLFFLSLFALSPFVKQQYVNEKLGIRLDVPGNWKVQMTERFLSLILKPRGLYSAEDSVSIVIWANYTTERNLIVALEDDLVRLKTVSKLEEIVYIHPPKTYTGNNYEAAIVTIEMPIESTSQNGEESSQPMDIIAINGGDRLVFVFVRKSNTSKFLNQQANTIVQSIELLNAGK